MKKRFFCFTIMLLFLFSLVTFVGCGSNESENEYNTVSFETNGGSSIVEKSCAVIEVSPTTLRDDYNFIGWYFDKDLTRLVTFPLSIDSDMTLYAKWEKTKEKIISDCMSFIDNEPNQKLNSQEDNSTENCINTVDTLVSHIGDRFRFEWEKFLVDAYVESKNLIKREYSLNLLFEYGNLESATGYFDYTYEFYDNNGDLWAGLNASYKITSITKSGETYLLNGYFTLFNNLNNNSDTQEEIKNSLQTNFTLSLYDFKFLFPVEYWNSIFSFPN